MFWLNLTLKNNLKYKKAYFMARDTDVIGEKQRFLTRKSFLNRLNFHKLYKTP